jgi:hypothetical protein
MSPICNVCVSLPFFILFYFIFSSRRTEKENRVLFICLKVLFPILGIPAVIYISSFLYLIPAQHYWRLFSINNRIYLFTIHAPLSIQRYYI